MERKMIIKHGIYRHFKGGYYEVLCFAMHTETSDNLVIYKNIETNETYARPLEMFLSKVDKDKYPDATDLYRFNYDRYKTLNYHKYDYYM